MPDWSPEDLLPQAASTPVPDDGTASAAAANSVQTPVALPSGGGVMPTGEATSDDATFQRWLQADHKTAQQAPAQFSKASDSNNKSGAPSWSPEDFLPPPAKGSVPTPAPQEAAQQPAQDDTGFLGRVGNVYREGIHAATLGADDVVLPGIRAPFDAAIQGTSLGDAYDKAQQDWRAPRQAFEQQHPVVAGAAGLAGGLATMPLMAPLFGAAAPGASLAERGLNYARNAGASALVGGVAGFGEGEGGLDQRLAGAASGAAMGGGMGAVAPAVVGALGSGVNALRGIGQGVAPIFSHAAQEGVVGSKLADYIGNSPIEQAPLPVPLDLAQATNNPRVASLVRTARGVDGGDDLSSAVRDAQQAGMRSALGSIAPVQTAADASTGVTNAVRSADDIVSAENARRWTAPELDKQTVSVAPVQSRVSQGIAALQQDEPGLATKYNGDISAAVDQLNSYPQGATPRQINQLAGQLRGVARDAKSGLAPDSAKANLANRVAQMMVDGIGDAIDANPPAQAKAMRTAYQNARSFTRETSPIMGTDDARSLLRKNGAGVLRKDASRGADAFFDFTRGGGEGVDNLMQMHEALGKIEADWKGAGHTTRDGLRAPDVARVRQELLEQSRSFVTSRLVDAVEGRGTGNLAPNRVTDWINTNRGWIKNSGLFTNTQVDTFNALHKTAEMIARPENLRTAYNSVTTENASNRKIMDNMLSPWIHRLLTVGKIGAGASGLFTGHIMEGMVGAASGHMAEGLLSPARNALKEMLTAAAFDPKIAADLMMKATPENTQFIRPQTRVLMTRVGAMLSQEVNRENEKTKAPTRENQRAVVAH